MEEAVPALYPGIVQQMVMNTKNTTQTVFMGGDPNNPFGDHSVHAHASSPGAGGTMTILPPWQISAATYSVAAACPNLPSGCWITIPEGTGALPAFTSVPVTATIDPGTLGPGYYPANISTTLPEPTVQSMATLAMTHAIARRRKSKIIRQSAGK